MKRTENPSLNDLAAKLTAIGEGAPDLAQKLQFLHTALHLPPDAADAVFIELLKTFDRLACGLQRAGAHTAELRQKIDELVGKLWYPAIFMGHLGNPSERRVLVQIGNTLRVVGVAGEVPVESLAKGCEVMLNQHQTAVVAGSARGLPRTGEIGTVVEKTPHGSLILRSHEEEVEVELAASLENVALAPGDRVRWSSSAWIAFERIEQAQNRRFLLGETPDVSLDAVGGQQENLDRLLTVLSAVLVAPDKAADYGVTGRCSVLLTGPPGCGKTLMVRAVVSYLAKTTGRRAKFFVVKPGEWESSFVSVSERNVRDLFSSLREAAKDGSLVVLFIDEIDSVGRHRGHFQGQYADKTLNALLAELDGFTGREGVAVVATTNRKDLIDNALLQRLSDQELSVRPPDINAAKSIFSIHLRPGTVPFSPNGDAATLTRQEIIETALSRIYNPNSCYAELCRIKFRDGKTRTVSARDFASGRLIEQICRASRFLAYQRELRTGQRGLQVCDMEEAVAAAMEKVSTALTIHSVRNQLPDLPTDVDVVAVERLLRKVTRPHRFLSANACCLPQGISPSPCTQGEGWGGGRTSIGHETPTLALPRSTRGGEEDGSQNVSRTP
ncbi:MAG: AAA family ATPase [Tepidisphaeraceae bacterium]|jgi:proteasome-associated ATPase